jgi:hypothetical protein
MKKFCVLIALAALAGSVLANPDVGVSVSVNQPGVYGRIDIGQAPVPPVVVYRQPMVIVPGPVAVQPVQPIYLRVPPGHSRHWRQHCHRYNACGQPVYFVREDWYQRHYYPHHDHHDDHRHHHGGGRDR